MTKKERKGNDKVKANGNRLCPLSTSRLIANKTPNYAPLIIGSAHTD